MGLHPGEGALEVVLARECPQLRLIEQHHADLRPRVEQRGSSALDHGEPEVHGNRDLRREGTLDQVHGCASLRLREQGVGRHEQQLCEVDGHMSRQAPIERDVGAAVAEERPFPGRGSDDHACAGGFDPIDLEMGQVDAETPGGRQSDLGERIVADASDQGDADTQGASGHGGVQTSAAAADGARRGLDVIALCGQGLDAHAEVDVHVADDVHRWPDIGSGSGKHGPASCSRCRSRNRGAWKGGRMR